MIITDIGNKYMQEEKSQEISQKEGIEEVAQEAIQTEKEVADALDGSIKQNEKAVLEAGDAVSRVLGAVKNMLSGLRNRIFNKSVDSEIIAKSTSPIGAITEQLLEDDNANPRKEGQSGNV